MPWTLPRVLCRRARSGPAPRTAMAMAVVAVVLAGCDGPLSEETGMVSPPVQSIPIEAPSAAPLPPSDQSPASPQPTQLQPESVEPSGKEAAPIEPGSPEPDSPAEPPTPTTVTSPPLPPTTLATTTTTETVVAPGADEPAPAPAAPAGTPDPAVVLSSATIPQDQGTQTRLDFESLAAGSFSAAQIGDYWSKVGAVKYARVGGPAEIAGDGENQYLRIAYPKGQVGHGESGTLVSVALEPLDRRCVAYRVRFPDGFDPVKGGKLPGLSGGVSNTGGNKPDGSDGWSARVMWRRNLAATQYLYHPDQAGGFGEDLAWSAGFPTGQWVSVETCVFMNTPGNKDGIVQSWMDGQLVLDRADIRFRDTTDIAVDRFLFHSFFGGSSGDWAPTKDEFIDFDDFVFSDAPAG